MNASKTELIFNRCIFIGFCLILVLWTEESTEISFFLILILAALAVFRWRFPKACATVLVDIGACILIFPYWPFSSVVILLPIFDGIYRKFYGVAAAAVLFIYFTGSFELLNIIAMGLAGLCGLLLSKWNEELTDKFVLRDEEAGKYYKLENIQKDFLSSIAEVERMTAVTERARIARDLHDNAGHEIVAAYISLQAVRGLLEDCDDVLELYDAAMKRLDNGVKKIRETAHNLQTVTSLGVESLIEICSNYKLCTVEFNSYGDSSKVPVYVWSVISTCLSECLTNAARHARPTKVSVELDVTAHLVRMRVENNGVFEEKAVFAGNGLRNLRYRINAIGGSFSVDVREEVFRVICVVPLKEDVV